MSDLQRKWRVKRDSTGRNTAKTLEEFIRELPDLHRENHDYSNSVYNGCKGAITFTCRYHGVQSETIKYHKGSLTGCKLCEKRLQESKRKIKNKQLFIEHSQKFHNNKYDYSKVIYTKTKNKVTIICPIHGEFKQSPSNHRISGCEACGKMSTANKLSKNPEDVLKECTERFGDRFKYDMTSFISSSKPFTVTCKLHGEFKTTLHGFLSSTEGCPTCFNEKEKVAHNRVSEVDNVSRLLDMYGSTYNFFTEDIRRGVDKVRYYCSIHHTLHSTQLKHLWDGHACPQCGSDKGSLKLSGFYNETVIERKKEFFKTDPNNIYLLHLEDDKYKVGLAKDISTRISSIKWGSHLKPTKLMSLEGNTYDLFYKEQSVLSYYKEYQYVYPKDLTFKGYTEVLKLTLKQLEELQVLLKEK